MELTKELILEIGLKYTRNWAQARTEFVGKPVKFSAQLNKVVKEKNGTMGMGKDEYQYDLQVLHRKDWQDIFNAYKMSIDFYLDSDEEYGIKFDEWIAKYPLGKSVQNFSLYISDIYWERGEWKANGAADQVKIYFSDKKRKYY